MVTARRYPNAAALYRACASADPDEQRDGYTELGRLLYRAAYDLFRRQAGLGAHADALAQESAQQALIAIHRSIANVRVQETFLSYSRRTLVRLCKDVILRERVYVRPQATSDDDDDAAAFERLMHQHGAASELLLEGDLDCVLDAIQRLPRDERIAIVLKAFARLEDAEIAAMLGATRNVIQVRRNRGRNRLREDAALAKCLTE